MKLPVLKPEMAALLAGEMTTAFYVAKLVTVQQHAADPDVPLPSDEDVMRDVRTTFARLIEWIPEPGP